MLFDVQHYERDGWQVLAVVGELDLASAPRVRQAVVRALGSDGAVGDGDGGVHGVVLDLGAVDFIDSSGLGVIIGAQRRLRAVGRALRLVVTEPHVREVFALTGLDRILDLSASLDQALRLPAAPARPGPSEAAADG